ncbi:MAG: AraC family transcriptional regulator [Halanaerobiaceae bacterium]|nr:AraC family transcriptional regulator [Halanaerobiaceae bacterium]
MTNKELKMDNILSLRKKLKQNELSDEINMIHNYLAENRIKRAGPLVTAIFNVEQVNGEQIIDIEILAPMDKKNGLPEKYNFKEKFYLTNAVYARHEWNPAFLQETYNKLIKYINDNNLQQITPAYNVYINEFSSINDLDEMIIDIYIGINPNIL